MRLDILVNARIGYSGSLATLLLAMFSANCPGQPQSPTNVCNAALIPTVEQSSRDERRIYSYMWSHAEDEYDRLKSMSMESRAAEASYKIYSAEYEDSKTKEEFRDKTKKRIDTERVFSDDKEATSYFRTGLEDFQLERWTQCITTMTSAGGLLLSIRNERPEGFTLAVTWVEPVGDQAERLIDLQAVDGAFLVGNAKTPQTKLKVTSSGTQSYAVLHKGSSSGVSIIANTPGFGDDILWNPPAAPLLPVVLSNLQTSPQAVADGSNCSYTSDGFLFKIKVQGAMPRMLANLSVSHGYPSAPWTIPLNAMTILPQIDLIDKSKLTITMGKSEAVLAEFWDPNPAQCKDHEFHIRNARLEFITK